MKTIPFDLFFQRVTSSTEITTQLALAAALGVNRSAITQAKTRNAVPHKWILALSRSLTLSPDWLEFGIGNPRQSAAHAPSLLEQVTGKKLPSTLQRTAHKAENNLIAVPKVSARLCAGAGSFEVQANKVDEQQFPFSWLSRMGAPASMVLMDVTGKSMEPSVFDGDTVLIDQSQTELSRKSILAVGVDDSIFLKRVESTPHAVILHSDNVEYNPIVLSGDECDSFRVLGRVVWLCRDCRFI